MKMRLSNIVSILTAAGGAFATNRAREVATNDTALIAKGFIIEYEQGSLRPRESIESNQNIQVLRTFDSDIFSGASIETNAYTVESLSAVTGIKRVWPNKRLQLSPVEPQSFSNDASAANYTAHNATGVNKLHAKGIYGEGVVVGVVDSGTLYTHPALGGGFGPGYKVAGGHDFVGDAYWPGDGSDKTPDDDPLDYLGHGTHVTGIIAGESDYWSGVAPKATINSYKVFSRIDSTDEATLIDAFLTAYNDGVDIITASIGSPGGWATDAWAEVASRIVDEGIVVTIAAGNSGADGPFFGSTGSSGTNVLSVAAIDADTIAASPFEATFTLDGVSNTTAIGYLPSTYYFPAEVVNWPIRPLNFNTSDPADGCQPYPNGTASLVGVIPLVRRGTCSFQTKQENMAALGAEYILFYNNEGRFVSPATDNEDTLIGIISAEAGVAIIETVKASGNVTADFSVNPESVVGVEYPSGGLPSTFTQWGGTYDLQVKPDIAAPGGFVFSTYLDNTFALLSGTSQACPYIAGVAALYIGVHGGRAVHGKDFAKMLHRRIIASGRSLPWYNGEDANHDFVAPVTQIGNGLVDAFKVVQYTTSINFEKMALNDTKYFQGSHAIEVTNTGDNDVTYKFSFEAAAGFETFKWFPITDTISEYRIKKFSELTPVALIPQITLPEPFVLKPGETKPVVISFDNPRNLGWNSTAMPLYTGKVTISGSNGEQLALPYAGIAADLEQEMFPFYRATYPFSRSNVRFVDIKEKSYYTFNLSRSAQDFPKIYSKIVWGSRQVRWDIFEADWEESQWTWPLVAGENGYIGPGTSWVNAGKMSYFDPDRYDPDETFTYPVLDVTRNAFTIFSGSEYWWFGKLGNGSQIANGNYTMRFATLRPFGDPAASDSWAIFDTPTIQVLGHY
ncbi:subtilase [Biscogniauxia marginata]|nr:subtilase [Biscogniauxia marginata]